MYKTKGHVFLGMSGGIDSSASASILLDAGYTVTGITFVGINSQKQGKATFIKKSSRKCCSSEEVLVAKNVCHGLGISHLTLDLETIFEETVQGPFIQSYLKGETPNPCMLCNRFVKLGALVDFALKNGADFVAMGHYCSIEKIDGEYLIKSGADKKKDQSYFLGLLRPEILPYLLFPLSDKTKEEVRALIHEKKIPIQSNKAESQDVCFIDGDYREYLKNRKIASSSGNLVFGKQVVGQHNGIAFFSLGQRKKLGVSLGKKVFVQKIDPVNNNIILGEKPKSKSFCVEDLNIFSKKFSEGEWFLQIRYQSAKIAGKVTYINTDQIRVDLFDAQEIISPGQYAVFYKNAYIYAAGRICSVDLCE